MDKLEKTIYELEEEIKRADYIDADYLDCVYVEMLRDALEILKKQKPVEPVFERPFLSSIEIYDCGKCGTSVGAKGIAKYCMKCGQAVKWN